MKTSKKLKLIENEIIYKRQIVKSFDLPWESMIIYDRYKKIYFVIGYGFNKEITREEVEEKILR